MTVPLIGEKPFKFVSSYPTTNILCRCGEVHGVLRLLTLYAVKIWAECGGCGNQYCVVGFDAEMNPVIDVKFPDLPKV